MPLHGFAGTPDGRIVLMVRQPQDVQRIADGRERVPQLVGQDRQELVLADVSLAQVALTLLDASELRSGLVLPLPRSKRRANRAHEGGHSYGPLEHRHVAELIHRLGHHRGVGTGPGEDENRQVGPHGLLIEPVHQAAAAIERKRLLGQKHSPGTLRQGVADLVQIRAAGTCDTRPLEDGLGQDRVPFRGRENEEPLLAAFDARSRQKFLPSRSGSAAPSNRGTPVSTPRKFLKGSPTLMRPASRRNSRMDLSCAPPRFLTMEIAWRTSPFASKYRMRMTASAR